MQTRPMYFRLWVWTLVVVLCLQGQPTLSAGNHLAPKHRPIRLQALEKLLQFAREPGEGVMVTQMILELEARGFSVEDLDRWVWIVSQQPAVVDEIGLEPFFDFAIAHRPEGLLALLAACTKSAEIYARTDLVRFALAAKRLIELDAGLRAGLEDHLKFRRTLDLESFPAWRDYKRIDQTIQEKLSLEQRREEVVQIGEFKKKFEEWDPLWVAQMEKRFADLGADRWVEWQVLDSIQKGLRWLSDIKPPARALALILEQALSCRDLERYQRMTGRIEERIAYWRELQKFLSETLRGKNKQKLDERVAQYLGEPDGVDDLLLDQLARETLGHQNIGRQIRVETTNLEPIPAARGTKIKIRILLSHLIENALQAASTRLSVGTRRQGDIVVLEVVDDGVGITEAWLSDIFRAGTKGVGGEGLAICKRWVKKMGGTLEVQSTVGKGTTFRLCLPLALASGAAGALGAEHGEGELPEVRLDKQVVLDRCTTLSPLPMGTIMPEVVFREGCWLTRNPEKRYGLLRRYLDHPRSVYYARETTLRKIHDFASDTMSLAQLESLLREEDENVLGNFESLDSPEGVIAKMNRVFYGAYGAEVFRIPGGVPHGVVNDPEMIRAVAREIYNRLQVLETGKNFVFHLWGFGGMLDSSIALAEELERLDSTHGAHLVDRFRYVLCDVVPEMVDGGKQESSKYPVLADWQRRGILYWKVLDATDPPADLRGTIDAVMSTYLYDSLPQRFIVHIGEEYYEIKVRPVLVPTATLQLRDGRPISSAQFKRMFLREDLKGLALVSPLAFGNVQLEQILVPVNPSALPSLRQIPYASENPFYEVFLMSDGMMDSIRKTLPLLKSDGEIWSFDVAVTTPMRMRNMGSGYRQNLGAVYSPVNALTLADFARKENMGLAVMPVSHWLDSCYDDATVSLSMLSHLKIGDLMPLFPVRLLRNYPRIERLAKRILSEGGYTEEGRDRFLRGVQKILGGEFMPTKLQPMGTGDYLGDLQLSIALTVLRKEFLSLACADTSWLRRKGNNPKFLEAVRRLGFDERMVDHLLEYRNQLNRRMDHYRIRIGRAVYPRDFGGVRIHVGEHLGRMIERLREKRRAFLTPRDVRELAEFFRPEYRGDLVDALPDILVILEAAQSVGKAATVAKDEAVHLLDVLTEGDMAWAGTPENLHNLADCCRLSDPSVIAPQVYARLETLLGRLGAPRRKEMRGPWEDLLRFALAERFGVSEKMARRAIQEDASFPSRWIVRQSGNVPENCRYNPEKGCLEQVDNPTIFYTHILGTTKFFPPVGGGLPVGEVLQRLLSTAKTYATRDPEDVVLPPGIDDFLYQGKFLTSRAIWYPDKGELLELWEKQMVQEIEALDRAGGHAVAVEILAQWANRTGRRSFAFAVDEIVFNEQRKFPEAAAVFTPALDEKIKSILATPLSDPLPGIEPTSPYFRLANKLKLRNVHPEKIYYLLELFEALDAGHLTRGEADVLVLWMEQDARFENSVMLRTVAVDLHARRLSGPFRDEIIKELIADRVVTVLCKLFAPSAGPEVLSSLPQPILKRVENLILDYVLLLPDYKDQVVDVLSRIQAQRGEVPFPRHSPVGLAPAVEESL